MIKIGIDYRAKDVITVDAKGYAMLGHDGKLKIRGATLKARNAEPFLKGLKELFITKIFENDELFIMEEVTDLIVRIQNMEMKASEICERKTLNMSLDEYRSRRATGNTNPIAVYELALRGGGSNYDKGDVIKFYVKGKKKVAFVDEKTGKSKVRKEKKSEAVEFAENFDFDYDPDHYLDRLYSTVKVLLLIFEEKKFREMFPKVKLGVPDLRRLTERQTKAVQTLNYELIDE